VSGILVNVDVDDLEKGTRFYCEGLGLRIGRRFDGWVELVGAEAPVYLLPKAAGTEAFPRGGKRNYARHWTPVHLDFVVSDIRAAMKRALEAGATLERDVTTHAYGKLALMSDPFGNGFCLLEFTGRGYDEITVTSVT
jgi:predicted enzyme related to lactoylglutathione lyase